MGRCATGKIWRSLIHGFRNQVKDAPCCSCKEILSKRVFGEKNVPFQKGAIPGSTG